MKIVFVKCGECFSLVAPVCRELAQMFRWQSGKFPKKVSRETFLEKSMELYWEYYGNLTIKRSCVFHPNFSSVTDLACSSAMPAGYNVGALADTIRVFDPPAVTYRAYCRHEEPFLFQHAASFAEFAFPGMFFTEEAPYSAGSQAGWAHDFRTFVHFPLLYRDFYENLTLVYFIICSRIPKL